MLNNETRKLMIGDLSFRKGRCLQSKVTLNSPMKDVTMRVYRSSDISWAFHMSGNWEFCCVEACLIDRYLRNSGLYVHDGCCLGYVCHPLTYVGCRRFWDGPST